MEVTSLSPNENTSANASGEMDTVLELGSFPEYRASLVIWKYCLPVLLLLGGFGNVATIFVLRRINWGQSTQHVFLTALAVVDLALLSTGCLDEWARFAFHYKIRDTHPAVCKLHVWLVYSLGTSSAWLLTAVTVQRAMSVVWPHRINIMCSGKKSTVSVIIIFFTALVLQSPQLLMVSITDRGCRFTDTLPLLEKAMSWVDLCGSSLLPFMILLVCNVVLVSGLSRFAKHTSSLTGNAAMTEDRKRMARSMTVTVLCLSVAFLILTLPVCVNLLWRDYVGESFIAQDVQAEANSEITWAVTSMLWYTNSAINFLLYCVSGTKFRNEFIAWITCRVRHTDRLNHRERHISGVSPLSTVSGQV